jgi:hypothetical protein
MEVNDTKKALLTKELRLQTDKLLAEVSTESTSGSDVTNIDSIKFSDEWTNNKNVFSNATVEKIESTTIADLVNVPEGLVYNNVNDTLTFVDDSLSKYFGSSCKIEGSNQITLNELVSDIEIFDTLDKINNFGDVYDFQFRQLDFSTNKYSNVKSFVTFEKILGYFSIDKLLNDELIRKNSQTSLNEEYANTDRASEFPPYSGFLKNSEYLNNGWVSIDQIIRSAYNDDYAYDAEASLAIRTPKIKEAKRALIVLTLSYVCDIFNLNSFNKLSDFGVRILDRTTGKELSVTNTKNELIEKIANTIIASYSGELGEPVDVEQLNVASSLDKNQTKCKKTKTNKCNGTLFTTSDKQNTNVEEDGFIHEIDAQVRLNPFRELLLSKPDILNTIDPIHWTSGVDNLTQTGELYNIIKEFGSNTYKSGKLNQDRAFAYGAGEFTNGIAVGGYFHDSNDVGITNSTESWNGIAWTNREECPLDTACGLTGGNQDLAVMSYGLGSSWTSEDKTFDSFFKPSVNTLTTQSAIFQNNTWKIITDISPALPRHSVAGKLNIKYDESVPGENIEQIYDKSKFVMCNEAISQAKQFASQKFDFSTESSSLSGAVETPNTSPRVWFDIWQCNGIAFGGSNSEHQPMNEITEKTETSSGITDEFESISWTLINKNTMNPEDSELVVESETFGCWFVDPIRKYPLKALGVSYVGTNESGLATGGKTSNSLSNETRDNVKVNMKNYYFDVEKYNQNNLSVVPYCYENNGISWIRRDDLPEAVYYHAGVGDNEYALFFGGLHGSLETPQVYTAFKNCQDWETLINLYGGAFARNGAFSLNGNLRYSSFSNIYDGNSVGAENSYGNSYFKNRNEQTTDTSTVIYSSEYINSENQTVQELYPNITDFLSVQDPEFTFPNKQIHTNVYKKLIYTYNKVYFKTTQYSIVYDLVFDQKIISDYEKIIVNVIDETITVLATQDNEEAVKQYFGALNNISLTSEDYVVISSVFKSGTNKLISLSEDSPANKTSILDIWEEKLTDANIGTMGVFTYYIANRPYEFVETYTPSGFIPYGVAAKAENYLSNLGAVYAGHPSDGGLWLCSRPTIGEVLYDPKNFLNENCSKDELIQHGFSITGAPNLNEIYTYFVAPALFETYTNTINGKQSQYPNYAYSGLYQYLEKDNDDYTVNETWQSVVQRNPTLLANIKKKVTRDGYSPTETRELTKFPYYGTDCVGSFAFYDTEKYSSFTQVFSEFVSDQFTSPEIRLDRDLIHIHMYDNDSNGYLGYGDRKSSSIRDKAGLWPWVDLLGADASNDCVVGDYTYRWDLSGNLYFALVEEVNTLTDEVAGAYKQEKIKITKYLSNGKKAFDYTIDYKENLDITKMSRISKNDMVYSGEGTKTIQAHVEEKNNEYGIFYIFGDSIKRQTLKNNLHNSLHVYGNKQNYEISDRTILSYNWDEVCKDEFNESSISGYPFKYTNICELIKENDLYNNPKRYQLYLEAYSFGDGSSSITPAAKWYNPLYYEENSKVKTIIPPQILTENLCGMRENLIKLRYNLFTLAIHNGLFFGDIRVMGEDLDRCCMPTNCSIIACGDAPTFVFDYDATKGQPEYYMDKLTNPNNLEWRDTGIATDFTSNMFGRFRRDVLADNRLDTEFLVSNGLDVYPLTYKDSNNNYWSPLDIAKNSAITNKTLGSKANAVIFCGGVFDVMYDKNFYETIYFLEEMAKLAQNEHVWFIFLTIPPRAMMQYDVAIERHVWYNNLVGGGRLDDPVGQVRMSIRDQPRTGDTWNVPMTFGPYSGLADPFIGKTKLEKLVAINEWMKSKLPSYDHDVLDLYDFFADKTTPATNQQKYVFNPADNTISPTGEEIYGFINPEYTNGRFSNDEQNQFNGLISCAGNEAMINFIYESVDLTPRFNAKIMDFDGNIIDPKQIFDYEYPQLSRFPRDAYYDLYKVGVENTFHENPGNYDPSIDIESVRSKPGQSGSFSNLIHKACYETLYFDLLCCLLKQDTCYASCYETICDILGDNKDDPKYKWKQHNHEEWTLPILESPFAGPFSTDEFNVWLASGNTKGNRWGTNIWASDEGGVITVHHKKQRIGINDPQAGYALEDGVWKQIEKTANRGHLYYATITTEVKISHIEVSELEKPTACRVFYDEFIFDLDAYSEQGIDTLVKDIISVSYPGYNGTEIVPRGQEYNTKYEILGLECDENANAYQPAESQLNPYVGGDTLCNSESFSYTEWVTSFLQEMKNNVGLRKVVDQKENKYFFKYDINRPFGSTTYKDSESTELTQDIKIVETEWRRYQDGVGLGGDAPILNVSSDNKLVCNELDSWFIGQTAFGTPDRAVVFGGFAFPADGKVNASTLWWENLTTDLTFKWNKFAISPEDTFNKNYSNRILSSTFTNKEPTTAKSSLGAVIFDLTNNILVERQGTAIFDKQNSVQVTVELPEILVNKDKYSITLTPSDNINCWWENKTPGGFTIKVDAEEWSGSVEWFVTLNDKVTSEDVDKDSNKAFNSYEEL